MEGFNVLHPMGWDAFGLPAENAAIKNKVHPDPWTRNCIRQMKEAMESGVEAARKQGVPGAERVSEEDARKLEQGMKQLGEGAGAALRVPRANVELFRKHQADIRKYAMHGLAFLGL